MYINDPSMKHFTLIVFVFIYSLPVFAQGQVSFTGVDQFWKLADLLQRDIEPTEEIWQALFDTPGYRYLIDVDRKEKTFKKYFPLVFMPSRKAALDSVLKRREKIDLYFLEHYLEVARKRKKLERFQKELNRTNHYEQALPMAARYLPDNVTETYAPPRLAFVIYAPDGTATDGLIVIDLLRAMSQDLVPFLAHEAHHHYTNKITKLHRPHHDNDDYDLIHSIAQLQLEGIADLIDKKGILETATVINSTDSAYERQYKQHYQDASEDFKHLDELITEIAETPSKMKDYAKQIREMLPFGGHPHGAYMAKLVEDSLGKAVIVETLTNPFAFIRAYNEAASQHGGSAHVFTDEALAFLDVLEKQYVY